jgi:hypothetical protein
MTRAGLALTRLTVIVVVMLVATMLLGWIGPVAVAVGMAAVQGKPTLPAEIGVGAALAWALVIVSTLLTGGVRSVAMLGAALQMPAFILPLASVLFVAVLTWSAATLVAALRRAVVARRPGGAATRAAAQ